MEKKYSGALQSGAGGAASGFAVGGPVGALVGGGLGLLKGFFGGSAQDEAEDEAARQAQIDAVNREGFLRSYGRGSENALARFSTFDPSSDLPGSGYRPVRKVMPDFSKHPTLAGLTGPALAKGLDALQSQWQATQLARDREAQQLMLVRGANRRISDADKTFSQYQDPRLQQLEDARVRDSAQAAQQAQRQGWGSSSIAANINRGVNSDYQRQGNDVRQQNMLQRLSFLDRLKGERQNTLAGIQIGGPDWQTRRGDASQAQGIQYGMEQDAITNALRQKSIDAQKQAGWLGAGSNVLGAILGSRGGGTDVADASSGNRLNFLSQLPKFGRRGVTADPFADEAIPGGKKYLG